VLDLWDESDQSKFCVQLQEAGNVIIAEAVGAPAHLLGRDPEGLAFSERIYGGRPGWLVGPMQAEAHWVYHNEPEIAAVAVALKPILHVNGNDAEAAARRVAAREQCSLENPIRMAYALAKLDNTDEVLELMAGLAPSFVGSAAELLEAAQLGLRAAGA
jgi:hypothetical protein